MVLIASALRRYVALSPLDHDYIQNAYELVGYAKDLDRRNWDAWIEEVLKPWQRTLSAHLETHPYIFGARPSLADFAFFGGNAARLLFLAVNIDDPPQVFHMHGIDDICGT